MCVFGESLETGMADDYAGTDSQYAMHALAGLADSVRLNTSCTTGTTVRTEWKEAYLHRGLFLYLFYRFGYAAKFCGFIK